MKTWVYTRELEHKLEAGSNDFIENIIIEEKREIYVIVEDSSRFWDLGMEKKVILKHKVRQIYKGLIAANLAVAVNVFTY